jgi:hypothetical protein
MVEAMPVDLREKGEYLRGHARNHSLQRRIHGGNEQAVFLAPKQTPAPPKTKTHQAAAGLAVYNAEPAAVTLTTCVRTPASATPDRGCLPRRSTVPFHRACLPAAQGKKAKGPKGGPRKKCA